MAVRMEDEFEVIRLDARAQPGRESEPAQEVPPVETYEQDEQGFADTDIANARRFADQHRQDVRFTPERGWLVWDGRRWAADEKSIQVQERAKQTALAIFDEVKKARERDVMFSHAKRSQSKRSIEAMLWLARSEPGIPARLTDFDADGWLLNVTNGTVDLRTGEVRAHHREDLISNLSNVEFITGAECELWDSFLRRVTDHNDALYAYLRRFVGYLLVADVSDQSLHFLHGTGANGKSVFCEVLQRLLGDYAVTVSPDLIMLRRHGSIPNDVARLRGVRAALMNETSQGSRFDEAKLKDLTGGDTLTARFLHAEFFDFSPTHRLLIRGNHKPAIAGTDEGIWRRLRLIPFTVSIPPDEQDRDLLRKLEGELPGILQWAIAGCLEWQRDGLKPPSIVTDAVRQYRDESDTLGRFVSESCEVRHLAQVKSSVFYERYRQFAEQAGERWIPQKDLPAEMEKRGFTYKRSTGGQRLYLGLEFAQSEASWQPE
jgi:putative DNA primase/helicase